MADEVVSEEVVDEVLEDETPLPSDVVEEEVAEEQTLAEVQAELKALKEKNEKAEDIAKRLKDEKSQNNRELSKTEQEAEAQAVKTEFMQSAITEAIENGGTLSEEAIEQAKEKGIDVAHLELGVLKTEKMHNEIYESAGGKDAYFDMVDAVKENVTEAEISTFQSALSDPKYASLAILALKQRHQEVSSGEVSTDNRITTQSSGQAKASGIYDTEGQYFADKRAAAKLTGQARNAMMEKISAKLRRSSIGKD